MSAKRARFDPSAQLPASDNQADKKATSPMSVAMQHIRDHLSSLRPEFASILEKHASAALSAKAETYKKQRNLTKMETDETVIPRSARVKFDLTSKHKPVETSTEFVTLVEKTTELVAAFQSNLKTQIVAAAKLDIQFLEQEHRKELAKALRLSTKAFLIADSNSSGDADTDKMVNTILDRHHEELLKYCKPVTLTEFRTLYMDTHGLGELPAPRALVAVAAAATTTRLYIAAAGTDPEDSLGLNDPELMDRSVRFANAGGPPPPAQPVRIDQGDKEVMKIYRTLESIFVVPWKIYLDTTKRNDVGLELTRLSTMHFDKKATDDAAMAIDNEVSADQALLKELISKLVIEKTSALQQKLDKLEKNNPRGQARGASNQKEKSTAAKQNNSKKAAGKKKSPTKDDTNNKQNNNNNKNKGKKKNNNNNNSGGNQKADDADSASSAGKKKAGKKQSGKKKNKSNSGSTTRIRNRQVNQKEDETSLRLCF